MYGGGGFMICRTGPPTGALLTLTLVLKNYANPSPDPNPTYPYPYPLSLFPIPDSLIPNPESHSAWLSFLGIKAPREDPQQGQQQTEDVQKA